MTPDSAGLLYLAALLHDVGKVFGSVEEGTEPPPGEELIEEWKKANCPAGCARSRNRCLFHPMMHAPRGAAFLLAAGLPAALRDLAALVASHHAVKKDNRCRDGVEALAQATGCSFERATGLFEVPVPLQDLSLVLTTADRMASSASRLPQKTRLVRRLCSPFWFIGGEEFAPVELPVSHAAPPSPAAVLRRAELAALAANPNFFASPWEELRRGLRRCLGSAVEAREKAPDVRLWTHAAMTAAVALCYHRRGQVPDFYAVRDHQEVPSGLRVVCVSFTGADRVVDVPTDGALCQVRGRAAALSLLTRGFAFRLLRALGLPPECVLLSWNAGCFVLLPDTASEELSEAVRGLAAAATALPEFASLRVASAPVGAEHEGRELHLFLRQAMQRAWHLAAYGFAGTTDVVLLYPGERPEGARLVPASRCRVCRAPVSGASVCPACAAVEELGIAINRGRFSEVGFQPVPESGDAPPGAVWTSGHLRVAVAPGGWPWQPPIGPGSPQQKFTGEAGEQLLGLALVRCQEVEELLSSLKKPLLLPGRLAECFHLAGELFAALHRQEQGVWALRWAPGEALLLGGAEPVLKVLAGLPSFSCQVFGFGPRDMGLQAALNVCRLDAPWREALDVLRAALETVPPTSDEFTFLADGTPFDPGTALALLWAARENGADGKFALDLLQVALSRGRRPRGFDLSQSATAVSLSLARSRGTRRQALKGALDILAAAGRGKFVGCLTGNCPGADDLHSWLVDKGVGNGTERGPVAAVLASLALARRILGA